MFEKTTVKLTAVYLSIMMAISIFFSLNLYRVSVHEFNRTLQLETVAIQRLPNWRLDVEARNQLLQERQASFAGAKTHLLGQLLLVNIVIFAGGGLVCYYLARRTLEPIEESHQALERFTGDASHELRTPVAAMRTEIEVSLMNPKLTLKQAKQQLQSNLEELGRLTSLVEGLLRLASLDNKALPKESVLLGSVIKEAIAHNKPLAKDKKISLEYKSTTKAKVHGNKESLVEVLNILLDNAIKYSSKNSAVVIGLKTANKQAKLTISDEGIGMNPSEAEHIFERFYRADEARSKHQAEGYGLGLAIAQDIIVLHGGQISVSTKPQKGSTFSVTLPL